MRGSSFRWLWAWLGAAALGVAAQERVAVPRWGWRRGRRSVSRS